MNTINTNFKKFSIFALIAISFTTQAQEEIEILSIDVTGKSINEQNYISGSYLTDKLIRFNSIKSNNSGSLLDYFTGVNSATNELSNHINLNLSSEKIASLTSITYKKFGDVSMGKNRVHGFQNWGLHSFYTEFNNFQDTMITNTNPSVQRGVGFNQIDLTNKILFSLNASSKLIINSQFSSSSDLQRFDQLNNLTLNDIPEYAQWNYGPQKRLLNSISFSSYFSSALFDDVRAIFSHQYIEESRVTRRFNNFSQK